MSSHKRRNSLSRSDINVRKKKRKSPLCEHISGAMIFSEKIVRARSKCLKNLLKQFLSKLNTIHRFLPTKRAIRLQSHKEVNEWQTK